MFLMAVKSINCDYVFFESPRRRIRIRLDSKTARMSSIIDWDDNYFEEILEDYGVIYEPGGSIWKELAMALMDSNVIEIQDIGKIMEAQCS